MAAASSVNLGQAVALWGAVGSARGQPTAFTLAKPAGRGGRVEMRCARDRSAERAEWDEWNADAGAVEPCSSSSSSSSAAATAAAATSDKKSKKIKKIKNEKCAESYDRGERRGVVCRVNG